METRGAVLSTGALSATSGGRDTGSVRLEPIAPRFDVRSIGMSSNSNSNDHELTRFGPQGALLASQQADRVEAFDTVVGRVLFAQGGTAGLSPLDLGILWRAGG